MKLPGGGRAVVDLAKLRYYCLNPSHLRGRHKARVLAAMLGLGQTEAEFLREQLLRAARDAEAIPGRVDQYGERYTIDFQLARAGRVAMVRSSWIILRGEEIPRLTSCYVRLN